MHISAIKYPLPEKQIFVLSVELYLCILLFLASWHINPFPVNEPLETMTAQC